MLTEELCFDYVICFCGNIVVTATTGETHTATAWVSASGRAHVVRGAAANVGCAQRQLRRRPTISESDGAVHLHRG
jgi:hypothetical protein